MGSHRFRFEDAGVIERSMDAVRPRCVLSSTSNHPRKALFVGAGQSWGASALWLMVRKTLSACLHPDMKCERGKREDWSGERRKTDWSDCCGPKGKIPMRNSFRG